MLKVSEINKTFGDVQAIEDLSFSIEQGEIVGLLGPNGAGKTTTMRIMSGFLSPDKGDVVIDDVSITKNPTLVKSQIGYLPENNPLYKDMLVEEFLAYSAKLKGLSQSEYQDALKFVVKGVEIKNVLYRPIRELSKGFKQRVGIATAMLHRPKLLILDEPTEGLDPKQRVEIRQLIKDLAKEHTVIVSTHVLQEVESICTRVIILNKGKKVADGTVKELSANIEGKKVVYAEIEGSNIENEIKKFDIEDIKEVRAIEDKKYAIRIGYDSDKPVQPKLSNLIRDNHWTVWKLVEETQQMEEIFKELTK